jgi:hypothetical protein
MLGTFAAVAAGAGVLFLFDPNKYPIYPLCPLHQLTGWSCPGCGTLRAVHQLAHGNFAAAWQLNPLTVSLMPVGVWLGLRELVWQFYGVRWPGLVTRPAFGWALLAIALLFGIVRNLPGLHI